jgi:hypothetical protein
LEAVLPHYADPFWDLFDLFPLVLVAGLVLSLLWWIVWVCWVALRGCRVVVVVVVIIIIVLSIVLIVGALYRFLLSRIFVYRMRIRFGNFIVVIIAVKESRNNHAKIGTKVDREFLPRKGLA